MYQAVRDDIYSSYLKLKIKKKITLSAWNQLKLDGTQSRTKSIQDNIPNIARVQQLSPLRPCRTTVPCVDHQVGVIWFIPSGHSHGPKQSEAMPRETQAAYYVGYRISSGSDRGAVFRHELRYVRRCDLRGHFLPSAGHGSSQRGLRVLELQP